MGSLVVEEVAGEVITAMAPGEANRPLVDKMVPKTAAVESTRCARRPPNIFGVRVFVASRVATLRFGAISSSAAAQSLRGPGSELQNL